MSSTLWDRLPGEPVEPRTVAACMPRQVPGGYMAVSGATATDDYQGYEYLFVETNHRYHALSLGAGTHGGDGDVYAWERVDETENDGLDGVADAALRMGFGDLIPDVIVRANDDALAGVGTDDYTAREYVSDAPTCDSWAAMSAELYENVRDGVRDRAKTVAARNEKEQEREQYLAMNGLPDVDLGREIEVEVVGDVRDTVEGTVVQVAAESLVIDDGDTARHVYDSHVAASEKGVPNLASAGVSNLAEQAGQNGGGESSDPADDVLDAAMLGTYEGGTVEIDGAEFAATDVTFEWSAPTDERVGVGAEFVGDDDREFEVEVEAELETEALTEAVRAAAEQAAERAKERARERAVSLRE